MSALNEFESIFRRAEREPFVYTPPAWDHVTILTDRDGTFAEASRRAVVSLLPALESATFDLVTAETLGNVSETVQRLTESPSDLIVAFRHLNEAALVPQHSLGVYLDVLTQVLTLPVLVLPGTATEAVLPTDAAQSVLVMTDHIRGDSRLISTAAAVSPTDATLHLAHIEDDAVFQRYLSTIDRIPQLDSDAAREHLEATLLGDAEQYMDVAIAGLNEAVGGRSHEKHLVRGHRLQTVKDLIVQTRADLCVLNTKDDGQLAMHGLAYAVAVEAIEQTLLLL